MSLRMGAENLEINQAPHALLKEQISQKVLLEVLLEHSDFAHFRKYADDDYRDPNQKNAPLSLSTKGWYDHSGDKGGSLFELTKERHLIEEARARCGQVHQKNRCSSGWDTSKQAFRLWESSEHLNTNQFAENYFTGERKIPKGAYQDLLKDILRVKNDREQSSIVFPMLTPEQIKDYITGIGFKNVRKLHRIFLSEYYD